jgi:hypothetical protein
MGRDAGAQTYKTGDDEVGEAGVVVVAPAIGRGLMAG